MQSLLNNNNNRYPSLIGESLYRLCYKKKMALSYTTICMDYRIDQNI